MSRSTEITFSRDLTTLSLCAGNGVLKDYGVKAGEYKGSAALWVLTQVPLEVWERTIGWQDYAYIRTSLFAAALDYEEGDEGLAERVSLTIQYYN